VTGNLEKFCKILGTEQALTPEVADKLCWRWSSDGTYSLASSYAAMFVGSTRPLGARQLWKTRVPLKVKHFFWLVLRGVAS
jgi:hypothetical protein